MDQECQTEHTSGMVVSNISRMGFIGFITEVVNCTALVKRRSEKINIISSAACKHLGWEGISSKDINKIFNKTGDKKERERPVLMPNSLRTQWINVNNSMER